MIERTPVAPIPEDWICVGRITKPQALRGAFRLSPETDDPESVFEPGLKVWLMQAGAKRQYEITAIQPRSGFVILKFQGVDSIDEAERLRGQLVYMERSQLPELDEDSFYYSDLPGCQVVLPDGKQLGLVSRVQPGPGGDLIVVVGEGREYLIPAVKQVVKSVDLARQMIEVDPPEGLLE